MERNIHVERKQVDGPEPEKQTQSWDGPAAADLVLGLAGVITFVLTAVLLGLLAGLYGQWLGVTAEYPLVFSFSFLLLTAAVTAGAPCATILAARRTCSLRKTGVAQGMAGQRTAVWQTTVRRRAAGWTTADQAIAGQAADGQTTTGQTTAGQATARQTTSGQTTVRTTAAKTIARRPPAKRSWKRTAKFFIAGAGAGFLMVGTLWLLLKGMDGKPWDWPGLLWLTQAALSGAAAGAVIGTGISCKMSGGGRTVAGLVILFLFAASLLMLLPFVPVWRAKESFRGEAATEISRYFDVPSGVAPVVSDQGQRSENSGANRRFEAVESWESAGRKVSITITGERQGYHIAPNGIRGYVRTNESSYSGVPVNWEQTGASSGTVSAALDLSRLICLRPLTYISSSGRGAGDRTIILRGEGVEAVARPASLKTGDTGIYMTFSVNIKNR